MTVTHPANGLRRVVAQATEILRAFSPARAAEPLGPGKWSPKEILGHLIDSASNNHGRFVRAQHEESLCFSTYDQNAWVVAGHYADATWPEVLELWERFNGLIARVMENASPDALRRERTQHNFHRIAGAPVEEGASVTLEFFMQDYVDHIRHHLAQIDPRLS